MKPGRGFTLLELLVSLLLLASVLAAAVSWLDHASVSSLHLHGIHRFRSAAHAATERIAEDILCGDLKDGSATGKVQIDPQRQTIRIRTRAEGRLITNNYLFDPDSHTMSVHQDHQGRDQQRLLLGSLATVSFTEDVERGVFVLTLTSLVGDTLTREVASR